jgi:uncharacterized membrane protein YhfC
VEIAARGAAALIMIAMPLALGAFLVRRFKTGWGLFVIGAVTFIGSQILHIPFNLFVLDPLMATLGLRTGEGSALALAGAAVLLGLSAGVFEEGARWLVYRFWIRKARTWPQGVVYGSGHGGGEAMIIGVFALAALVQMVAVRGQDLAAIVPAEQLAAAQAQVELYWALPAWASFFGVVERASALAIQIALAVIVLQAFLRPRGGLWLLAAIGWHALVDAVAVFAGVSTAVNQGSIGGMFITELLIVVLAGISLVMLFRLRPPETLAAPPAPAPLPHVGAVAAGKPTADRVEASRFTDGGDAG